MRPRPAPAARRAAALLALAACAAPRAARAQAGDAVPRELVAALVAGPRPDGSAEALEIVVGRVPPALADALPVPRGARVLGTVVDELSATAMLAVRGPPAAARARYADAVRALGWRDVDIERRMSPTGGVRPQGPTMPLVLCRGDRSLHVSFVGRADGGTNARVRGTPAAASACAVPARPPTPSAFAALPALRPPPVPPVPLRGRLLDVFAPDAADRAARRAHPCRARTAMGQRAEVRSDMPPAALLAFYDRQFAAQGWRRVAGDEAAATGTWERREAGGRTRRAVMVVTPADAVDEADSARCAQVELLAADPPADP